MTEAYDLALGQLTADARLLLNYMAFLDPNHIQIELFVGPVAGEAEATTPQSNWQFDAAVESLTEHHLIERCLQDKSDSFRLLGDLQRCILDDMDSDPGRRDQVFEEVVSILRHALPTVNIIDRSDATQFPIFAKYLPHVFQVNKTLKDSHPPIKPGLLFVDVIADVGFYCHTQDSSDALPLLYTGENICNDIESLTMVDKERRDLVKLRADVLSAIAVIVKPRGKKGREKAMGYIDRVIALREEELRGIPQKERTGQQGTNYIRALADRAFTLCCEDRVDEAMSLYNKAIDYYSSVENETRIHHIRIQQLWYHSTKQDKETTRRVADESLKFMIQNLGDENPLTQQSRYRVAGALFTIGDVDKALPMHKQAFDWRLAKYGKLSYETLGTQYCLAVCYQHTGELGQAEEELREILRDSELTEEWRIQDVMRVKFRLYLVIKAQGKHGEATHVFDEMKGYLTKRRGDVSEGDKWSDKDIMELLDGDIVTLDHGRTCGIWSNGVYW
ncbi:hypothetical protein F5Y10DRAFT_262820 [Nemania abortiva]|nr:hypothetical protein F5Y10DRAFT_262820 [Nemania abortiva]